MPVHVNETVVTAGPHVSAADDAGDITVSGGASRGPKARQNIGSLRGEEVAGRVWRYGGAEFFQGECEKLH